MASASTKNHSSDANELAAAPTPEVETAALWSAMTKLLTVDREFVHLTKQYKQHGLDQEQEENFTYTLTGSMVDGSNVCKWIVDGECEMECDCQAVIARITAENFDSVVETLPGKPDNVRLKFKLTKLVDVWGTFTKEADKILGQNAATGSKDIGYISSAEWRNFTTPTRLYYPHPVEVGNLASTMHHSFNDVHVDKIVYVTDFVYAIHSDKWPRACDFIRRNTSSAATQQRQKPAWNAALLKEIAEAGLDIVPKASPGGDQATEWRWSFAGVETKLFQSLSSQQMVVYLLAKMMFYKHVKHAPCFKELQATSRVHSYWIKTTMMWMCEHHHRDLDIWSEASMCQALNLIYTNLLQYLREWHLPSFFVVYDNDDPLEDAKDGTAKKIERFSILKPSDRAIIQDELVDVITPIVADTDKFLPTVTEINALLQKLEAPLSILRHAVAHAEENSAFLKELNPDVVNMKIDELLRYALDASNFESTDSDSRNNSTDYTSVELVYEREELSASQMASCAVNLASSMALLEKIGQSSTHPDVTRASTNELIRVRDLLKVFADDATPDDPDFDSISGLMTRLEGLLYERQLKRAGMARVVAGLVSKLSDELDLFPTDDSSSTISSDETTGPDEPLTNDETSLKSVDDQTSLNLVTDGGESVDYTEVELIYSRDEWVEAWEEMMEELLAEEMCLQ